MSDKLVPDKLDPRKIKRGLDSSQYNTEGLYREIGYSIGKNDDGTYRWELHPKMPVGGGKIAKSDTPCKSRDEAIKGAKAAIDKMLQAKP